MNALLAPTSDPALGRTWPADFAPVRIATIGLRRTSPDCALRARRFVAACCMAIGAPELARHNAEQCVSELCANCVDADFPRGRGWFFVQAFRVRSSLLVRVHDPVMILPSAHAVDVDALLADPDMDVAIGGWGLSSMVEAFADSWSSGIGPRLKFVEFSVVSPLECFQ
jgi:hypothetical protein